MRSLICLRVQPHVCQYRNDVPFGVVAHVGFEEPLEGLTIVVQLGLCPIMSGSRRLINYYLRLPIFALLNFVKVELLYVRRGRRSLCLNRHLYRGLLILARLVPFLRRWFFYFELALVNDVLHVCSLGWLDDGSLLSCSVFVFTSPQNLKLVAKGEIFLLLFLLELGADLIFCQKF